MRGGLMATYFDPTSSTVTTVSFDMDSIARTAQIPSHPAPITMYFVIERLYTFLLN
jgi:hypothetical protein